MAGIVVSVFANIFRFFVFILFVLGFIPVFTVLIILCSPVYLLRFTVSNLSIFGPRLVKIIPAAGTFHVIDDIYGTPKCAILLSLTLKGNSANVVMKVRQAILNKLIGGRKDNGEATGFKADELRYYPYKWMGFYFWRWDDTFDISNHVNFYTSPEIEEKTTISQTHLRKIEQDIVYRPFMKNKSPWDFYVVQNVESDNGELNSVLYFRYHHLISDGLSAMKIFYTAFFDRGTTPLDKFLTSPKPVAKSNQTLLFCQKLLLFPFQLAKYSFGVADYNEWIAPDYNVPRKSFSVLSEKIDMADLKEIAKIHNVGVNAIIYAGFAAGVRKAMLKKKGKIPRNTHIGVPIHLSDHPNTLSVHVSLVALELPIRESDSMERLRKIHKTFIELKYSFVPQYISYLIPFVGSLFPFMVKGMVSSSSGFAGSSSFPGPKNLEYICDQEVLSWHFLSGTFLGQSAVFYYTLSYFDGFRIVLTSNSPLIEKEEEVHEIVQDILQEFSFLKTNYIV